METFLIKAAQLILALLILVTIHEFGHYIFARCFGIKVSKFYLFFNPWFSLLKYYPDKGKLEVIAWTEEVHDPADKNKILEEKPRALLTLKAGKAFSPVNKKGRPSWAATLYGLGWLPLGGYCAIEGMVDETTSADQLSAQAQPWEFRSRPAYQRLMVMVAGVVMNFLLAIIIYAGIAFHWGDHVVPFQNVTEGMDFAQPLVDAGFKTGDILLEVNGKPINARDNSAIWELIQPNAKVKVLRNHTDSVTITIPEHTLEALAALQTAPMGYRVPVYADMVQGGMPAAKAGILEGDRIVKVGNDTTPSLTEFFKVLDENKSRKLDFTVIRDGHPQVIPVEISDEGKIGIQLRPVDKIYDFEEIRYSLLKSVPRGWQLGTDQLVTYVSSLKLLFTKTGITQVGGFGTLGNLFPTTWSWYTFWQITAFLSIILAFMNIIPIPGLDGGHVLFLLVEMVIRRPVPLKFMEYANYVGFSFLLLLLLYANGMDLVRIFQ